MNHSIPTIEKKIHFERQRKLHFTLECLCLHRGLYVVGFEIVKFKKFHLEKSWRSKQNYRGSTTACFAYQPFKLLREVLQRRSTTASKIRWAIQPKYRELLEITWQNFLILIACCRRHVKLNFNIMYTYSFKILILQKSKQPCVFKNV